MKKAYLEITMKVSGADRAKAGELKPCLAAEPEILIYEFQQEQP